jgi:hypothetical protein
MFRAGFEPAISTSERPKTILASDRSAIETGTTVTTAVNNSVMTRFVKFYTIPVIKQTGKSKAVLVLNQAPRHEDVSIN